jgi:aminomethyltransferase
MPNSKGGIVDDLIIYRVTENEYFLVVNASNIEKDWNWISSLNDLGVEMENVSDNYSLLAIQGPKAAEAMQSLTDINLSEMVYYTFTHGTFAGIENVMISATGYTGSGGFEIYVKNENIEQVWDAVFQAGASFGIKPIGLAARDTLRLEMGFCLYGNDIDDTTSPLEAGLGWITKFTKDFVYSDFLKIQKEEGVTRKLVAFEMIDRGIPRHDYPMSPSMKVGIGLGYVAKEFSTLETEIFIEIREKGVKAKVVKLPFYKK